MNTADKRRRDTLVDDVGTTNSGLFDDLTRIYRSAVPPPHLDAAVLQALRAATPDCERRQPPAERVRGLRHYRGVWHPRRLGLASLAAVLLLALSGAAGYLRLSNPTPVSAQSVLRHAAALQLAPGQAAHMVYRVSMAYDGLTTTGTADVWLRADTGGAPALSVQTLAIAKPGVQNAALPAMRSRFIQIGEQIVAYNPELRGDNMIVLSSASETRVHPSWALPNAVFDGASVAESLSTLARQSPQQVRLLPQQALDGATVDAIEVDGWTERPGQRTILYFDAQSYVLRGFDANSLDPSYVTPSWQARLDSSDTMLATGVPPNTFALDAPASATIAPIDLGGPAAAIVAATLTASCHLSNAPSSPNRNMKLLLRSGQSLLAACQATAPDETAADLVAALEGPATTTLDAAVAAGVLTPEQASAYLSQRQAQLTAWVTAQRGPLEPSTGSVSPGN